MNWFYNLRIGRKLGFSFGLVILLLVGLTAYVYQALQTSQGAERSAVKGLELSQFLTEKLGDHLTYVKNLEESIILEKEFTGQLDPTQCAFGKWYTSFAPQSPAMKEAYTQIDAPHRLLHKHAADIRELQRRKGSQREQIQDYQKNIIPALAAAEKEIRNLVQVVKEESKHEVDNAAQTAGSVVISLLVLGAVMCVISVVVSAVVARNIRTPIRDIIRNIDNADLNTLFSATRKDEIGDLQRSFDAFVSSLKDTLLQVEEASTAVASASSEISSSTEQMAAGSQEQTSQAGEVASAVEEMTKTIIENSKNATSTADTAKEAKEAAEEGGKVVRETVEGMKRIAGVVEQSAVTVQALSKSSDQIGEIIGVIDDIADQTNLLALNAAIEAARAGDQGRGFAVVADEVRKLAERTTKATKEITEMIKKIQEETAGAVSSMEGGTAEVRNGIKLAEKAGESLSKIVEKSETVRDMIAQIAAASEEQSSASEQISKNVEAISNVTGETAQGTQQIARAADDLNHLTENLQQIVERFQLSAEGAKGRGNDVSSPHPGKTKGPQFSPREPQAQRSAIVVHENGTLEPQNALAVKFDVEAAKRAHFLWRSRIQKLLAGKEQVDENQVVSHRDCALGKWYYSEGQEEHGSDLMFVDLGRKHEDMHKAVKKTATLWNSGRKEEAREVAQQVYRLSDEVVGLLDQLPVHA